MCSNEVVLKKVWGDGDDDGGGVWTVKLRSLVLFWLSQETRTRVIYLSGAVDSLASTICTIMSSKHRSKGDNKFGPATAKLFLRFVFLHYGRRRLVMVMMMFDYRDKSCWRKYYGMIREWSILMTESKSSPQEVIPVSSL